MTEKSRLRQQLGFSLLALLMLGSSVFGQSGRGAITGVVQDATGAVVPNAEVLIAEKSTGVETRAKTTDAGVYRAPYIPPGKYKLSVAVSGFKTAVRDNIEVLVAQTITADFTLELGEVSQEVTVSDETPLLESSTSEIGTNTTEKEVHTWPIQVNDGTRLLQTFIFSSLPGTQGGAFEGSINGGQSYSHEVLIDGISAGAFKFNGNAGLHAPTLDAVSEFKLQTGALSAQFGDTQTAVVNFGLKSGTNDFHGGAFWLYQNAGLNALNYSSSPTTRPPATSVYHNFGATVGGPVIKDKTHFFFSYEGEREEDYRVGSSRDTLPIDAFKRGDFSRLLDAGFTLDPRSGTTIGTDALGRPVVFGQIYDPRTSRLLADGAWIRDPFPGNIIPQDRFSTVSRNVLKHTLPGPQFDLFQRNNPRGAFNLPVYDINNWGLKMDHVVNNRHKVSGSYRPNRTKQLGYGAGDRYPGIRIPGPAAVDDRTRSYPGQMVRFAEDWTISPNKLNHFGFGYNRIGDKNQTNSFLSGTNWATELGLKGVTGATFPVATFGSVGGTVLSGGYRQYGGSATDTQPSGSAIVQDDFTWIRGKHSFKIGGEHRRYYLNVRSVTTSGTYNFNNENTALPGDNFNKTGFAYASFLLGEVRSANVDIINLTPGTRARTSAFYFQDDWKFSPKLTFNLGVRWDIPKPFREAANRLTGLDPTKPNPGADGFPGAFVVLGDGPGRTGAKSFTGTYYGQVGPRVGFAYSMNEKLVVRGGYGINYAPNLLDGFNFPYYVGFNGSNPIVQRTGRFREDASYRWDGTYSAFTRVLPNTDPTLLNGQNIGYYLPETNKFPMVQNWNVGVQMELPWKTRLEANYIGNKSKRLNTAYKYYLNQVDSKFLSLGDTLLDDISAHPEIRKPYPSFQGTVGQALRPFPQYQGVFTHRTNKGRGDYHSLQVTGTRRMNTLSFLAAYTWSRAKSDSDSGLGYSYGQDFYNLKGDYSVTGFHRPHDFKLTWIYEFPFGPKQRWAKSGALSRIIGGWTMSGIQRYTSGAPLAIFAFVYDTSGLFNPYFQADIKLPKDQWVIGGKPKDPDTNRGTPYLNPTAFGPPPSTRSGALPTRFGNAGRYLDGLRGFATWGEDFSLIKRTDLKFREGALFEIRMDVSNIFNRTGLNNPSNDAGDPASFGRIYGKYGAGRNIQVGARFIF